MSEIQIDTVYVGVYDSSMVITGKQQQVIIVQDNKPVKEKIFLEEYPLITILLVPILVAIVGTYFTFLLNRKKYKGEVDKLKLETEQIKNSYEQVVLDTIQQVNSGLLDQKIKGLQELVALHENFIDYDLPYDDQGRLLGDYGEYLHGIYLDFNQQKFDQFREYKINYGYLYNSTAHQELDKLIRNLYSLKESSISYAAGRELKDQYECEDQVPPVLKQFTKCFDAIRRELHLDNDFTAEYINGKITTKVAPKP